MPRRTSRNIESVNECCASWWGAVGVCCSSFWGGFGRTLGFLFGCCGLLAGFTAAAIIFRVFLALLFATIGFGFGFFFFGFPTAWFWLSGGFGTGVFITFIPIGFVIQDARSTSKRRKRRIKTTLNTALWLWMTEQDLTSFQNKRAIKI